MRSNRFVASIFSTSEKSSLKLEIQRSISDDWDCVVPLMVGDATNGECIHLTFEHHGIPTHIEIYASPTKAQAFEYAQLWDELVVVVRQ